MVARYTVYLEQISPETENGVTVAYDELPSGFSYIPGSTFSMDESLLAFEPTVLPTSQTRCWSGTSKQHTVRRCCSTMVR